MTSIWPASIQPLVHSISRARSVLLLVEDCCRICLLLDRSLLSGGRLVREPKECWALAARCVEAPVEEEGSGRVSQQFHPSRNRKTRKPYYPICGWPPVRR